MHQAQSSGFFPSKWEESSTEDDTKEEFTQICEFI